MIAPATLAERLQDCALIRLMTALEATLKTHFPGVAVRHHPGRIDVADLINAEIFAPPMIAIAAVRWKEAGDLDGSWAMTVEIAAYIVTGDMAIGGKAVARQDVAFALSQGLLQLLGDLDIPRWGLTSVTAPTKADARPLFTSEMFAKGAAYYAVTWEQTMAGFGSLPLVPHRIDIVQDFDGAELDAEGPV